VRSDTSYAGSLPTSDRVSCRKIKRLGTQKKALESGMNDLVEKPMKGENLKHLVDSNRRESNQIKRKDALPNISPASNNPLSGLGAEMP
jgi:hypothetical protein